MSQDIVSEIHRNHHFLVTYTEYVYRVLMKRGDYSIHDISKIVNDYSELKDLNIFFDQFTIDFANFCSHNHWDKTSASLGINEKGENIAKSTEKLLEDFKNYLDDKKFNPKNY